MINCICCNKTCDLNDFYLGELNPLPTFLNENPNNNIIEKIKNNPEQFKIYINHIYNIFNYYLDKQISSTYIPLYKFEIIKINQIKNKNELLSPICDKLILDITTNQDSKNSINYISNYYNKIIQKAVNNTINIVLMKLPNLEFKIYPISKTNVVKSCNKYNIPSCSIEEFKKYVSDKTIIDLYNHISNKLIKEIFLKEFNINIIFQTYIHRYNIEFNNEELIIKQIKFYIQQGATLNQKLKVIMINTLCRIDINLNDDEEMSQRVLNASEETIVLNECEETNLQDGPSLKETSVMSVSEDNPIKVLNASEDSPIKYFETIEIPQSSQLIYNPMNLSEDILYYYCNIYKLYIESGYEIDKFPNNINQFNDFNKYSIFKSWNINFGCPFPCIECTKIYNILNRD